MTSLQCANIQGDFERKQTNNECGFANDIVGSLDIDKFEAEFHLANETFENVPRSNSGASSSEVFTSSIPKKQPGYRPKSAKPSSPKTLVRHPTALSSIPLPVKSLGPIKVPPLVKNARSSSRTSSVAAGRSSAIPNKHTLEIQFINKNKRYIQMKKELSDKQRPVLDLYLSLLQIKKKLEELGKSVKLEDIKLVPYEEYKKPLESQGDGEQISMEVVTEMKHNIEEIPKTLIDICKNLLSRRALIVELLESVTRSEVDVSDVSDKIESLKNEGQQLQRSLDAVISEHQSKINILVTNWQKLLNDKQSLNADNKIEELENRLEDQERLIKESNNVIHDLYKKLDDRKLAYDKSIAELNGVIQLLKEQIKKLEQELDSERKTTVDFKTRNNTNAQSVKALRTKISELETEKKNTENINAEMQKKVKLLQDQIKHKEASWGQEKEELNKNLRHQENLLQKLTAEKNQFETRFKTIKNEKTSIKDKLESTIKSLNAQLIDTKSQLKDTTNERNSALGKCAEFENYLARIGTECKETMNKVSYSIEWGKAERETSTTAAENYIQEIAKDLRIRELQDKIDFYEKERNACFENENDFPKESEQQEKLQKGQSNVVVLLQRQQEGMTRYQLMLQESEVKLQEKSTEVEKLRSEIRQLKVRQTALEEQNDKYPTDELKQMIEKGQRKLNEVMKRSTESEHTVEKYLNVIEKQTRQINEMENLLRYRENMAKVLKASREELLQEKESLFRYAQEIRALLAEVTKQRKTKDCLAKELQEKVSLRDKQIEELTQLVKKLEADLVVTNEKRFKLQETIGIMENRLQECKRHKWGKIDKPSDNELTCLMPWKSKKLQNLKELEEKFLTPSITKKVHFYKKFSHGRECSGDPSTNNGSKYHSPSTTSDSNSEHSNCQHKANSRSLISLSLQTVDFLRTRLNLLSSVDMLLPENTDTSQPTVERRKDDQISSSVQTTKRAKVSKENVSKILTLSAKRYKYLQNQANESYEDLTKLVKLAVTQEGAIKK